MNLQALAEMLGISATQAQRYVDLSVKKVSLESIEEALRREAREELGIEGFEAELMARYVFESTIEKELVHTYRTVYEGPFTPDKEELDDARFWRIDEIESQLGKGIFTPNFEREYNRLKQQE